MKRVATVALVAGVLLVGAPGATATPYQEGPVTKGVKVTMNVGDYEKPGAVGCPYARLGVAYYRGRFTHWQLQRGAAIPEWRKPRSCADARYLATVWAKRAVAARQQTMTHRKKMAEAKKNLHPKWIALKLLGNDREQWSCLMSIVWVENRTMDPTLDYGGGHGNVYEAYGIPQANPGYKMQSAGPDWRTNPETQLRWMINYCRVRYGSVCGAAYSRRVNGMY